MSTGFLGLRTAKYTAADLAAAKRWYSGVLGVPPYFDEPFYVGFDVGGFELGITPDPAAPGRAQPGLWELRVRVTCGEEVFTRTLSQDLAAAR